MPKEWCIVYYGDIQTIGCEGTLKRTLHRYDEMLKGLVKNEMIPEFDEYTIVPKEYANPKRIDKYLLTKQFRRISNSMEKIDAKYDKDVKRLLKAQGW